MEVIALQEPEATQRIAFGNESGRKYATSARALAMKGNALKRVDAPDQFYLTAARSVRNSS